MEPGFPNITLCVEKAELKERGFHHINTNSMNLFPLKVKPTNLLCKKQWSGLIGTELGLLALIATNACITC